MAYLKTNLSKQSPRLVLNEKLEQILKNKLETDPVIQNIYKAIKLSAEGVFDKFKNGGIVSMSPEVDACRGELSRVMLDLGSFLKTGIGVGPLETGSTSLIVANESNRRYAVCDSIHDRTIVIVEIGETRVVQHEANPYCYTIYAEDCNDVSSVEKFIVKSVVDFSEAE